jgi:excisionase family DNA binding protein
MAPDKEYLSVEEVAEIMGVTYQLIYRLVRAGEMPAVRLGKLYRISRKELNLYLERSRQGVTAGGGTCSVCGQTYQSKESLVQGCTQCEAPICQDCWVRRRVHTCHEHSVTGKK